ncbi:hypothetical protein [Streptococcus halotolerans]|uniref:hypothetical protein n=1 Tax=Streptococcus halotolerans TaxID=1814128 RepID=UPI000786D347|nr:hypothetical protein [Streptococcus halotolerans]
MGILKRLFSKSKESHNFPKSEENNRSYSVVEEWEDVPAYIPATSEDFQLVSVIASSIAAGDNPDSQFKVKRILKRNPESLIVSLLASSIAAGDNPDSQFVVKSIKRKK